jgi:hypothetical protein
MLEGQMLCTVRTIVQRINNLLMDLIPQGFVAAVSLSKNMKLNTNTSVLIMSLISWADI